MMLQRPRNLRARIYVRLMVMTLVLILGVHLSGARLLADHLNGNAHMRNVQEEKVKIGASRWDQGVAHPTLVISNAEEKNTTMESEEIDPGQIMLLSALILATPFIILVAGPWLVAHTPIILCYAGAIISVILVGISITFYLKEIIYWIFKLVERYFQRLCRHRQLR